MKLRSHLLVRTLATLLPMVAFAAIASLLFAQKDRSTFQPGRRTCALEAALKRLWEDP